MNNVDATMKGRGYMGGRPYIYIYIYTDLSVAHVIRPPDPSDRPSAMIYQESDRSADFEAILAPF